jgi:3-hydroxyisobutyrate dehydrogenase
MAAVQRSFAMRYGFIGLGRLGRHLARNLLQAGFPLVVHDLRPEAMAALVRRGAAASDSVAALAGQVDAVITCLPSPAAVAAVTETLFQHLAPGTTWIETSTNDPELIRTRAAQAAERGIATLEAPVTGGVHKAASGAITVLAGGPEEVFARHRPVLAAMGSPVLYIGPLGTASTLKLITNMLAFVHLEAIGEALALSARAGIDLATAFAGIRASSGNSFVHETESQVILAGSYDIGFTIDLALKDLGLVRKLAHARGVPLPLAALVEERFFEARGRYGGEAWSPMIVRLLEDALGIALRAPDFPATLEPPEEDPAES